MFAGLLFYWATLEKSWWAINRLYPKLSRYNDSSDFAKLMT